MKTCPHCRFLVSDGATTCSVCHQDIAAPQVPATVGAAFGVPPGSPGASGAPGPPPPGGFTTGSGLPDGMPPLPAWDPGSPTPPAFASPAPTQNTRRIVLIACSIAVLGVVGLGVLAIGAVSLLGRSDTVSADDVMWQDHRDPQGRFQADMPGLPEVHTVEMPTAFGGTTDMEVLSVVGSDFVSSISITEGVVSGGMTFADIPFSADGAEQGVASGGFLDAQVVQHAIVDGAGDTQMDLELIGTVSGDPAVMFSRLVIVGPDIYELSVAGPRDQRDELAAIHEHLTTSFRAPAAP